MVDCVCVIHPIRLSLLSSKMQMSPDKLNNLCFISCSLSSSLQLSLIRRPYILLVKLGYWPNVHTCIHPASLFLTAFEWAFVLSNLLDGPGLRVQNAFNKFRGRTSIATLTLLLLLLLLSKSVQSLSYPRRLYILCWRQYSRRKLSPTLATPTTLVLTTLVAQCELSRR